VTAEKKRERRPWRENIEALTMAIAVALLFKLFILEISKIPSGSMQPTLMGSPETETFDRIVVDKLSFSYRDPERFEIVVFKHPLERSRIMVKRLVGLPGEDLKIEHGDLWTRSGEEEAWSVLRRTPPVMADTWRSLEKRDRRSSSWGIVAGGADWRMSGREILARGDGRARFRPDDDSVRDRYTDGYPDALRSDIAENHRASGIHPVGDLRLTGEIVPEAGTEEVVITLSESGQVYDFRLPGPAADAGDAPTLRHTSAEGTAAGETRAEAAWRLPAGEATAFAVENLDDRLVLELDGEPLLALDVEPVPVPRSAIEIALTGAGAELSDLMAFRDVHYYWPDRPSEVWQVSIPEGHYVMLGDNTQDSADSRDWESVTYSWEGGAEERRERGNYRPDLVQANPVPIRIEGEPAWAFRDEWGELHWLRESQVVSRSTLTNQGERSPLVPRELILGRSVAVFWPIDLGRRMWRLGWLH
jgi:signal peptidase I